MIYTEGPIQSVDNQLINYFHRMASLWQHLASDSFMILLVPNEHKYLEDFPLNNILKTKITASKQWFLVSALAASPKSTTCLLKVTTHLSRKATTSWRGTNRSLQCFTLLYFHFLICPEFGPNWPMGTFSVRKSWSAKFGFHKLQFVITGQPSSMMAIKKRL